YLREGAGNPPTAPGFAAAMAAPLIMMLFRWQSITAGPLRPLQGAIRTALRARRFVARARAGDLRHRPAGMARLPCLLAPVAAPRPAGEDRTDADQDRPLGPKRRMGKSA